MNSRIITTVTVSEAREEQKKQQSGRKSITKSEICLEAKTESEMNRKKAHLHARNRAK